MAGGRLLSARPDGRCQSCSVLPVISSYGVQATHKALGQDRDGARYLQIRHLQVLVSSCQSSADCQAKQKAKTNCLPTTTKPSFLLRLWLAKRLHKDARQRLDLHC